MPIRRHRLLVALAVVLTLPPAGEAPAPALSAPRCFGRSPTIVGTNGDDRLVGTIRKDVLVGLRGNDIILGLGGDDRVCGGRGHDRLYGGRGGDLLSGDAGNDSLFGEHGNDRLLGRTGTDGCVQGGGHGITDPCSVVVAAAGDIACEPGEERTSGSCHMKDTSDLLISLGLVGVLPLGDNQYDDGALEKYRKVYEETWGRVKDMTHPVPGNHEYSTENAGGYFDYFRSSAGSPSRGYYSYDLDEWHLIALNSNCGPVGGCDQGSPQHDWLKADLAASNAPCTLAYWHAPRFASGHYSNNTDYQPFWELLFEDRAEIVLNGHDHSYQRYAPMTPTGMKSDNQGIREFIVGTGGKNHTAVDASGTNREAAEDGTYGVLQLTLAEGSYSWQFIAETRGGYTDSGSASCH
jgi:calcineurin-like phosphoesterase family protein/hemolysin type calcium-binding protein